MSDDMEDHEYLSAAEASAELAIPLREVYRLVEAGELDTHHDPAATESAVMFRAAQVRGLLASRS